MHFRLNTKIAEITNSLNRVRTRTPIPQCTEKLCIVGALNTQIGIGSPKKANNTEINSEMTMKIVINKQQFDTIDVDGDGNCMFRSLCIDKYFASKNIDHKELRNEMVKRCRIEMNNDEKLLSRLKAHKPDADPSVEDYLERIGTPSVWAGCFECVLISYFFKDINIIFIRPPSSQKPYHSISFQSMEDMIAYRLIERKDVEKAGVHNIYVLFHDMSRGFSGKLEYWEPGNHFAYLCPCESTFQKTVITKKRKKRHKRKGIDDVNSSSVGLKTKHMVPRSSVDSVGIDKEGKFGLVCIGRAYTTTIV